MMIVAIFVTIMLIPLAIWAGYSIGRQGRSQPNPILLSDLGQEGIALHENGVISEMNSAARDVLGLQEGWTKGRHIADFFSAEYRNELFARFSQQREGTFQVRLRGDGSHTVIELSQRIVPTDSGPLHVVYLRDITKRRFAEEAMVEQAVRLMATVNHSFHGVALFSQEGSMQLSNSLWVRNLGLPVDMSRPETRLDAIIKLMIDRHEITPSDRDWITNNGEKEIELCNGRIVKLSSRRLDDGCLLFNVSDLTEQRHAERDLLLQRESIDRSQRLAAMGQLLAGVSHELNNPLSIVLGQASLLQETTEDQPVLDRAAKIQRAADRCRKIVQNFLTLARQRTPERKDIQLSESIMTVIDLMVHNLRAEKIAIHTHMDRNVPAVHVDPDQIIQVIMNLIVNAMQAMQNMKQKKRIDVALDADDYNVVVTISDNGPGIPEDLRSKVFEPFFTTKAEGEGTGIGLSYCRDILSSHGGRMSLDEVESGTCFRLSLPAANCLSSLPKIQAEGRSDIVNARKIG